MATLYLGTADGVLAVDAHGRMRRLGPPAVPVRAVAPSPRRGGPLLAASESGGVLRYAGGSWTRVAGGVAHTVAWSPDGARAFAGLRGVHLLTSDDGGGRWREAHDAHAALSAPGVPAPHLAGHPLDVLAIVAPHGDLLYLGVEAGGVLRCDADAGWRPCSAGLHPDVHALACAPRVPMTLFAATGRGLYRTADGGVSWSRSSEGMDRHYLSAVAVVARRPLTVLAAGAPDAPPHWDRPGGARAVVFRSADGGRTWEAVRRGLPEELSEEVSALAVDPRAPATVVATTLGGDVYESRDAGVTWGRALSGLPPISGAALAA